MNKTSEQNHLWPKDLGYPGEEGLTIQGSARKFDTKSVYRPHIPAEGVDVMDPLGKANCHDVA